MIRNEAEYKEVVRRFKEERGRMEAQEKELKSLGLSAKELKRAMDPMRSFHLQLAEEIENYEKLQRGDFEELTNLHGLGQILVALRIAKGFNQRELAEKLGVNESQVSRDERNEYHGISVERASKILDILGANLRTQCLGFIGEEGESVKPSRRKVS